ncbi:MAG TPA: cobalamin biosynthesis protein [Alphaproteobacteria bacterium]|nr:cobalamin biosynthesis protein [Alphaproteobacteria bacterium]MCB9985013.1 cobalamin biosynthesis protein [Micavibrio sp.]HPQ51257.1 cobalamin biosynthesis protein [Alphaproteobacteria bacterium]HRK97403.1 cobalamin biosynthesis protein [Alphaproteobacteria bacterium]
MFDLFVFHIFSSDRLSAVAIALIMVSLIGMMVGPVWGNANPLLWSLLDKICGGLVARTYNRNRSMASLHFRGAILLTLYLLITGIIAAVALLVERRIGFSGLMTPLLLSLTLSGGTVWASLVKLHHALRGKNGLTKGSYYQIAVSTRTDLNSTDDHGIIRVGIGLVATSFDKGLVAPIFWFLIGGLPAAYIYCGIAAACWSLSKDGFAKGIGTLALKLETAFGIVPQILSSVLIALAALATPAAGMTRTIRGLLSGKGHAPYAEGGLAVTAIAYALGVSLGGPVEDISGSVLKRSWVGSSKSTARVECRHLRQAIYLGIMGFVWVFLFIVLGLLAWSFSA